MARDGEKADEAVHKKVISKQYAQVCSRKMPEIINIQNDKKCPIWLVKDGLDGLFCLNDKSRRSMGVLQTLNSALRLIQRTTHGRSSETLCSTDVPEQVMQQTPESKASPLSAASPRYSNSDACSIHDPYVISALSWAHSIQASRRLHNYKKRLTPSHQPVQTARKPRLRTTVGLR